MAQFVTDAGLLHVLDMLKSDLTHIAVQNGAKPSQTSTKLNGEFARKAVVEPLVDGFTFVADGFFDETEANGTITGWGIFGDGATGAADSGTLFAATDASMTKTAGESLTLSAEITVRRVNM
jgi:hypothetical protein